MDTLEIAQKVISIFSSDRKDLFSTVVSSLLEGDLAEKILSLASQKDENSLSDLLKGLSKDNSDLLNHIQSAVEMVERGEVSTDNISDMVQKIAGEKLNDILGNFGKLF
jgi:Mg2+ and Co2+ transporter CorA